MPVPSLSHRWSGFSDKAISRIGEHELHALLSRGVKPVTIGRLASEVLVFIRTSPFRKDPQYSRSVIVPLRRPTGDTSAIVSAALAGLRAIYQPGFKFAKAGVMLMDIQPASREQFELDLGEHEPTRDRSRLMMAMDAVNDRWGRGSVKVGSSKIGDAPRDWGMKQERKTPGYTTVWDDMPVAKA